ncbi:MAG: glycoside hydrolase family 88 protein [Muribaculaceae bacterium]|nr:glycoside hydrolase family 88 protein [Muribaculaceae bacterium]
MKTINLTSCLIASLGIFGSCAAHNERLLAVDTEKELEYCHSKVLSTLAELHQDKDSIDYMMMPRNVAPQAHSWECRPTCAEEWCSGFWPGVLWYDYEASKDSTVFAQADKFTHSIKKIVETPVFDHDLGFLVYCSYGNGYRLTNRDDYKQVILNAADSLATLFNPKVGTILSWPREVAKFGGHNTIMDNMINLEMLFWAAKNGGNPYLHDIAVKHAETTMKNHFRDDYTSYHVAVYDSITGNFLRGCTHQGYADDSMWARGQAWAIYGFTVVYRETKDPKFLDFVQKVADVYLDRLPEDKIPYWDFDDPAIPNAPRDASAACVVASALLELSDYVGGEKGQHYMDEAKDMLTSASSDRYKSGDQNNSFLLHSTGHHPAGSEIDYSIIYADYYYIEALNRLAHLNQGNTPNSAEGMAQNVKN